MGWPVIRKKHIHTRKRIIYRNEKRVSRIQLDPKFDNV